MVSSTKRGLLLAATTALLLASCGGSSSGRARNSALTEGPPVVTNIQLSPDTHLNLAAAVDGSVYVTGATGQVTRISPEGVVDNIFVSAGQMASGIAVDSDGGIYVSSETESTITKFSPDGTVTYVVQLDVPPTDIAVGPDKSVYWISANEGTVSKVSPVGTNIPDWFVEAPNWFRERDEIFSAIDVDPSGNVAVADPNNGFVIVLSPEGEVKNRMDIRFGASEVKFAPSGDIYTITEQGTDLTVIRTSGLFEIIRTHTYSATGMAIDKSGVVYLADFATNSVMRISPDSSMTTWAKVGSGPSRIVVVPDGTVYTLNQVSTDVSKIVPGEIGGGETPPENLKPGLTPVFGTVTEVASGFIVPVTNFDPAFEWNVTVDNQMAAASLDTSTGLVTLTGLTDDMSAMVTVTSSRTGYEDGYASVVGSSLRPPRTPVFGVPTPTTDGFSASIQNFDPDWTWSAEVAEPNANASIDGSGNIVVTGLSPATMASVTVTTTRNGYMDGVSKVVGSSLAAESDNAGEQLPEETTTTTTEATTTTTTIADEPTSTTEASSGGPESTTSIEESTSTTIAGSSSDESTSTTPAKSPAEPSGQVAQMISTGKETIAAIPVKSISNAVVNAKTGEETAPAAVLVSPGTDEIACTSVCVDSLFASLGVKSGVLTAYVGDADPVTIRKGSSAILKVGTKDTNVKFVLKAEDGKESTVDIPVVHSDAVSGQSGGASGFSAWMLILLFAIIAMVMAFIYSLINRSRSAGPISD